MLLRFLNLIKRKILPFLILVLGLNQTVVSFTIESRAAALLVHRSGFQLV